MSKNILIIMRSAPYGQSKSKDAIDFILTAAAYDQEISVLFQNDGVFQLIKNQTPTKIKQKNMNKLLSAFEMYEIENLYIEQESIEEHGLELTDLEPQPKLINRSHKQTLLNNADTVLTF